MKLLLVESHYRSRSWFKALDGLVDLYILSVMPEERKLFEESGVPTRRILDLHHPKFEQIPFDLVVEKVKSLEKTYQLNVNQILLTDRTLRRKDMEHNLRYVHTVASQIINFIEVNLIDAVLIEPTWTHELILTKICKVRGIPIISPVKDKLLDDHFFIFKDHLHEDLFIRSLVNQDLSLIENIFDSLYEEKKPQYFSKFNKRNKLTFAKLRVFFDIVRLSVLGYRNKNIQASLGRAILRKLCAMARAYYYTFFNNFVWMKDLSEPFILVTLHVQPEASIDVVGEKFSNQLELVRQIVRTTPAGYAVLVKEHPHDFGQRGGDFYHALSSMSCVKVLHPHEESRRAIEKACLVISITGTSSLEAAMQGIPAVTTAPMYFKKMLVRESFDPFNESTAKLIYDSELWRARYKKEDIKKLMSDIWSNTFVGNSGDFKTDPNVLSGNNLENLRAAFLEVLAAVR
jgi:hypothetical protein